MAYININRYLCVEQIGEKWSISGWIFHDN